MKDHRPICSKRWVWLRAAYSSFHHFFGGAGGLGLVGSASGRIWSRDWQIVGLDLVLRNRAYGNRAERGFRRTRPICTYSPNLGNLGNLNEPNSTSSSPSFCS